jgi:hypothetical protein
MQDLLAWFDVQGQTPEEEAYLAEQQAIAAQIAAEQQAYQYPQITPPSFEGSAGLAAGIPQPIYNPRWDIPPQVAPEYTSGANQTAQRAFEEARLQQLAQAPVETFDYGTELANYQSTYGREPPTPSREGAFGIGGSGGAYSDSSGRSYVSGQVPLSLLAGPALSMGVPIEQLAEDWQRTAAENARAESGNFLTRAISDIVGVAGDVVNTIGDIPLPYATGAGSAFGQSRMATVGDVVGNGYDAYMYDIPYYSDFARETLAPLAGDVGAEAFDLATPRSVDAGISVLSSLLGVPTTSRDIGRFAGEAITPVTAGDVALELIPGIGTVPGVASMAPDLARGAVRYADEVVQPLIRAAVTPEPRVLQVAARLDAVAPVVEDSLAAATGAVRVIDPAGVRVLAPGEMPGPGELRLFHGTAGELRGETLDAGAWLTPNQRQAESYAHSASILGRQEAGPLRPVVEALAGGELGMARIPGGGDVPPLVDKTAAQVTEWQHGSKQTFDDFDFSKAHPGNEHGTQVIYITDRTKEAANYGDVRPVSFTGHVLDGDAKPTAAWVSRVAAEARKIPGVDTAKLTQRIPMARQASDVHIALQEIGAALPARRDSINEILRRMGYSAESYVEESGARSLAVFEPSAVSRAPSPPTPSAQQAAGAQA